MPSSKRLAFKGLRGWRTAAPPPMLQVVTERPKGYRTMGDPIWYTDQAVMFQYYDWNLWIPVPQIRWMSNGEMLASQWSVDTAQKNPGLHKLPDVTRLAYNTPEEYNTYLREKRRNQQQARRDRTRNSMRKKRLRDKEQNLAPAEGSATVDV